MPQKACEKNTHRGVIICNIGCQYFFYYSWWLLITPLVTIYSYFAAAKADPDHSGSCYIPHPAKFITTDSQLDLLGPISAK